MANTKKAAQPNTVSKKVVREDIEKKLEAAFAGLKAELGDKKFKNRVKKAIKVLMHGLKSKAEKPAAVKKTDKAPVLKKPAKATVKKTAKKAPKKAAAK